MNEMFRQHVENLHGTFEALLRMAPVTLASLPRSMPTSGIYLFSEGQRHLYVGRSRKLRQRLRLHVGGPTGASFAFRLAREVCGKPKATYVKAGSRTDLMSMPDFTEAFHAAKRRIRSMDVRFVEQIGFGVFGSSFQLAAGGCCWARWVGACGWRLVGDAGAIVGDVEWFDNSNRMRDPVVGVRFGVRDDAGRRASIWQCWAPRGVGKNGGGADAGPIGRGARGRVNDAFVG